MSIEESIRQIIREKNEKLLDAIEELLESHGYRETPRFLTVKEAPTKLRMGRTATYELCKQTDVSGFPCFMEGNRYKIPYAALINWIDERIDSNLSNDND